MKRGCLYRAEKPYPLIEEASGVGVQYIYDAKGRRTGVIVPIDLWYSLGIEKPAEEEIGTPEPGKYRGIYRSLKVDLKDELRKMRDEWNRI